MRRTSRDVEDSAFLTSSYYRKIEEILSNPVVGRLLDEFATDTCGLDLVIHEAAQLAVVARWWRARSVEKIDAKIRRARELPKWRLRRVLAYINDNISEPIRLPDLASSSGLSRMYFAAQFRAATGFRPHEYILRKRIARAKILLTTTHHSLAVISGDVGFQTQAHFTTIFKRYVGVTPAQWRIMRRAEPFNASGSSETCIRDQGAANDTLALGMGAKKPECQLERKPNIRKDQRGSR